MKKADSSIAFEVSLLAMASIRSHLEPALLAGKRYRDEALRWTIGNYMMMLVSSFDDEWRRLEGLAARDATVMKIVKVAGPAVKRIRSWKNVRLVRNSLIAHPRDKNGGIPNLSKMMGSGGYPTAFAEQFLVGELAVYAMVTAHTIGSAIHKRALDQLGLEELTIGSFGITSWGEFRSELNSVRGLMINAEPSLEAALGREPDNQQLN